jgi:hypothetical protein
MNMTTPFKFLDSYTKDDREIFFGREREVEELYHRVFEGKIMLVYGVSGTGKSSLIHCGLANKFQDADWLPVNIRRAGDMLRSMAFAINQVAITPIEGEAKTPAQFKKAVRSLYLDHYKPVFFIFDQFEELFIFGNREEKKEFIQIVKALTESDMQCRFMFVLREEYLAGITEFERVIPTILANRVRIERMTLANAKQVIEGPCKVFGIGVEESFSDEMLEKLSPGSAEVELTYLQVYLDKVYRTASPVNASEERVKQSVEEKIASQRTLAMTFTKEILKNIGEVKDLLGSFLDEQIELLPDPDSALAVLKSFVSVKGTKRQMSPDEVQDYAQTLGKPLSESALQELLQTLIQLRILRDKDQNNRYELRHDALATKIYEKITLVEKELLEIRHLIENAFHNWQKRGVLISAEDLGYIAPYENRLYLSKELEELIEKSKYALVKAKKRRRTIAFAAMAALLVVFAGFTWWALNERNKAIKLRIIAIEALEKTELAQKEAVEANIKVELANQEKERLEKLLGERMMLVISPSKMNILYRGVENPIDIAVAGIAADKIDIELSDGKVRKEDDGRFIVLPGKENQLTINAFTIINGRKRALGGRQFKVYSISDPFANVNGKKGGEISINELLDPSTRILAQVDAYGFDLKFSILEFTVGVYSGGFHITESTKGNKFSDRQKELFQKLKSFGFVYLYDIKAVGPDGTIRNLNSIVFATKE